MNQFTDTTFAKKAAEHLPLFEGMVNPSVLVEDELRLSRQCRIMYKRLLKEPATNVELQKLTGSMNPTARRTDLRQEMQRNGWNLVKIESRPNGVNLYALIDAEGKIIQCGS